MKVFRKVVPKRILLLNRKNRNRKHPDEEFEYSSDEEEYDDSEDEEDDDEEEYSDSENSEEEYDEEEEVEEEGAEEDDEQDEDEEEEEDIDEEEQEDDGDDGSYFDNEEDEESIEVDEDEYYNSKRMRKRPSALTTTPKSGKINDDCSVSTGSIVSPTRRNFFRSLKLGIRRKKSALSQRKKQRDLYDDSEDDEEEEEDEFEEEESEEDSSTVSGQSSTEEGSDEVSGEGSGSGSSQQRDIFSFDDEIDDVKLPSSLARRQLNRRRRGGSRRNPLTPTKRIINTLKALTPTRKKKSPKQEQIEAENAARAMEAADALGRDLEAMGFNLSCQSFQSNSTLESAADKERYGTVMQSDSESINLAAPSTVMSSRTPRNSGSPHSFKLIKSSQSGGSSGIIQSRSPMPPSTPEVLSQVNETSPKIEDKLDRKLEELQQSSFASDDDNMSRMDKILMTENSARPSNLQKEMISSERKRWFSSPRFKSSSDGVHPIENTQHTSSQLGRHESSKAAPVNMALSNKNHLASMNSPIPSPIEKTLSSISRTSQNSQSHAESSYQAKVSGRETMSDGTSTCFVPGPEERANFGRDRSGMSSTKFTGPEPPPDLESVEPIQRSTLSSLLRTIATQTSTGSHSDAEKILSVSQTMSNLNDSEQNSFEKKESKVVNTEERVLNDTENKIKLYEAKSCDESSKGATRCDSTIHTIHSIDVKTSPVVIEGMNFLEDKAETAIATEPSGLSQSMTTRAKLAKAKLLKIVMDRKEQETALQTKQDRQMHIPSPIPEKSIESRSLHPKRDPRKRVPTPFPGMSVGHRRSYSRQDLRVPSPIPEIRSTKSRRTLESSKSSSTRKREKVQSVLRASSYSPSPIKQQKSPRTLMKPNLVATKRKSDNKKIARKLVPLSPSLGMNHVKQWVLKRTTGNKKPSLPQLSAREQKSKFAFEKSTFSRQTPKPTEKKDDAAGIYQSDARLEGGNFEAKCFDQNQNKLESPNEKKRRVRFSLRKLSPAVHNEIVPPNQVIPSAKDGGSLLDSGSRAQRFFDEKEESLRKEIAVSTSDRTTNDSHPADHDSSDISNSWNPSGIVSSPVSFKVLDHQFGWSGDRCDSVEIVVLNNLSPRRTDGFIMSSSSDDHDNFTPSASKLTNPHLNTSFSSSKNKAVDQACQTNICQEINQQECKEESKPQTLISSRNEFSGVVASEKTKSPSTSTENISPGQVHDMGQLHSNRRPQAIALVKSLSISSTPTIVNQDDGNKTSLLSDIGKWLNPDTPKAMSAAVEQDKPVVVEMKENDTIGNVASKSYEKTNISPEKSPTRKKTKNFDTGATNLNNGKESPKRRKSRSPRKVVDEGFEIESRNGVISVVKNVCPPDVNKFLRDVQVESPETVELYQVDPVDRKPARTGNSTPKGNVANKKNKSHGKSRHDIGRHESVELTMKPSMSARSHNTKSTYSTKSKSSISRRSQKAKKRDAENSASNVQKKHRSDEMRKIKSDVKHSQRRKKRSEGDKKDGKSYNSISTASTKKQTRGSARSKGIRPSRVPSKLILKKSEQDDASVLTSLNSAQFADAASIINMNFATAWDEIAKASLVIEEAINKIDTSLRNGEGNSRTHDSTIGSEVEKALVILKKHADRLGVKESDLLLAVRSDDESTMETIRRVSSTLSKQNESATLSRRNESGTEYYTTADTNTSAVKTVKTMTLGEEILDIFRMYLPRTRTHQ